MLDFREVLSHCDLHDLGFSGKAWTYDNLQTGVRNVKVRLDRAVASPEWSGWFPHAMLKHIISSRSDHCPILLWLEEKDSQVNKQGSSRYKIMWEREPMLTEEIRNSWSRSGPINGLTDVANSLKDVLCSLKKWSYDKFSAVSKELSKIRKRMEEIEMQGPGALSQELHTLRTRMDELLYREEMTWLQRSRIAWLKEGDRNTSYFHRKAAARVKNKINLLKRENGQTTKNKSEMEEMTRTFFIQLYSVDQGVSPEELTQIFELVISDEANESLCKKISEEEISDALFQIGPLKAPGPDGLPTRFFQKN
jgi:hypothetical protein